MADRRREGARSYSTPLRDCPVVTRGKSTYLGPSESTLQHLLPVERTRLMRQVEARGGIRLGLTQGRRLCLRQPQAYYYYTKTDAACRSLDVFPT